MTFLRPLLTGAVLATTALGAEVLYTVGFPTNCAAVSSISLSELSIMLNNDDGTVSFYFVGRSKTRQNVTASLGLTVDDKTIHITSLDPCEAKPKVTELCPAPVGAFQVQHSQNVPNDHLEEIPSVAYQIPDIRAMVSLQLLNSSGGVLTCVESLVTNGKSTSSPALADATVAVAAVALGISVVLAAISSAGGPASVGPSFADVLGSFQKVAVDAMLSVNYPVGYRNFAKNFGFSIGLVPWTRLQTGIDDFRNNTRGNLTGNSVADLLDDATLVFPDGSLGVPEGPGSGDTAATLVNAVAKVRLFVHGIQAYAAHRAIPPGNVFTTELLVVVLIAAVASVGALLGKAILELWALVPRLGDLPAPLARFRARYVDSIVHAVVKVIMLFYLPFVTLCLFQLTMADSWATRSLAGVALGLSTGILAAFTAKIWTIVRRGHVDHLFDKDHEAHARYALFYDKYRPERWWAFMPTMCYQLAKACITAGADGHGLIQVVLKLAAEMMMFAVLVGSRPFAVHFDNVLGVTNQLVSVVLAGCALVFLPELGVSPATQDVFGLAFVAAQGGVALLLSALVVLGGLVVLYKGSRHKTWLQKAKETREFTAETGIIDQAKGVFSQMI